jgi:thioesterase domain-containing protein
MRETERPIYTLRARRCEASQSKLTCIADTVDTHVTPIRRRHPKGTYFIAGYRYGAMLASKIAKVIEGADESVGFLGSFNLLPRIKHRMRQLT